MQQCNNATSTSMTVRTLQCCPPPLSHITQFMHSFHSTQPPTHKSASRAPLAVGDIRRRGQGLRVRRIGSTVRGHVLCNQAYPSSTATIGPAVPSSRRSHTSMDNNCARNLCGCLHSSPRSRTTHGMGISNAPYASFCIPDARNAQTTIQYGCIQQALQHSSRSS